jgi:hypothetical protein
MRRRCRDPKNANYPRYGGRGIQVCHAWDDFAAFLTWALAHGWKPGLTIDRINNDGDYTPDNCRWVSHQVNCQNNRSCKISPATARAIRKALGAGQRPNAIAKELAVSVKIVRDIQHNLTWRNATLPTEN